VVFLGLAGVEGSFHGAKFVRSEVILVARSLCGVKFFMEGSFVFDETGFNMT
jgi:hypothetical protein